MDVPPIIMYSDPALIDTIVGELKSQGTFDQFRKECIADVDTKPAYQNLHQRVETTVSNFLEGRAWRSDLNKNQLRDSLRKHILEMGFLDTGVERIVDQVVNPKVHAVFMPQVEDVVYRVQGIPKPEKTAVPSSSSAAAAASKTGGAFSNSIFNQPPPFLPGLSFLPLALQSHIQKAPTLSDLLPTDLDPVSSPESSKDSDMKDELDNVAEESGIIQHHDESMDSQLSGISDLTSHGSDHATSIKSERRESVPFDDTNEDLSNASSKHKILDGIEEAAFSRAEECETEVQHEAHSTSFDDGHRKSSYASDPVMHYEDQYSVEEEVATTLNNAHCEIADEVSIKEEADISIHEKKKSPVIIESIGSNVAVDDVPENKPDSTGTVLEKYECTGDIATNLMDDNSLVPSEDSQLSGSSDNKLHIDEMKDFNSQSGNSHQNDDDQSGMKTLSEGFLSEDSCKPKTLIENVVEASEEARHGFDDSQDALERPPMPSTPPAPHNFNQPPPVPPFDSSSDLDEKQLPASSPPCVQPSASEKPDQTEDDVYNTMKRLSQTPPLPIIENSFTPLKRPDEEQNASVHLPCAPTLPLTGSPNFDKCPPLPPTPVAVDYPPLPPATPPPIECPPLPPTPPLPESLNVVTGRPPLPPTPPLPETCLSPGRPQLPPTPPLVHRLQHTKELSSSVPGPIVLPEDEFSRDSNMSPSYDEGAIPKTPQWEPRFSSTEDSKQPLSSFEFLGISDPSKIQKSFIPPMKSNTNEQDDASQSDSEEMQLAWSPLSTHDDDGNEDSKEKQCTSSFEPSSTFNLKESISTEVHKDTGSHSTEKHHDSRRDSKQRSSESEKNRDKDRDKNSKSRERRKDDSRHKESTNSSKKADETKHRDSRDRRDSSSRSRHEDKSRSGKDRDRHSSSSHHRSDDRKRDEKRDDKERTSSSKHRSSHSDDRHRHRDKDSKNNSSGSTSGRHEDKAQDEKSRTSSKGHSSDRDRRDHERKERDAKDRKSDKDKDRYRKESSRHDEKRKIKEREKAKRDKSSNVCRPHNERRSPDPDSNNGSTFGGNNQASSESMRKSNQCQDNSKQSNEKGSGSADSNNKSSETSQTNNCSIDSLLSPTSNQVCPSSSLPFKKRPLLPENDCDAMLEPSSGQLLLKIKRSKSSTNVTLDSRRRKVRALRKLERLSISSLDKSSNFVLQAISAAASTPPHVSESPVHYFETDWPTKSDDKAFLAYVEGLEHSKTLSDMSDFSQSDSEEEEIVSVDGFKSESVLEGRNFMLSLTILNEDEAKKLVGSKTKVLDSKRKEKKLSESKPLSSSSKGKARQRPRKLADHDVEVKRRKVNVREVVEETPVEPKSRRARKPNKRYSNDEFTSHFDYEEDSEQSDDDSPHMVERLQTDENVKLIPESHFTRSPFEDFSSAVNIKHASTDDDPEKVKDNTKSSSIQSSSSSASLCTKIASKQTEQNSYSWNRDSYNSNSEDEADNTNNENDLIGTALKNLMMESGLGGPVEDSDVATESFSGKHELRCVNHPYTCDGLHKPQLLLKTLTCRQPVH